MKINRIPLVGLLLGIVALIAVINCKDKPTPPPEPEEHLFYIAPAIGNMVKVFSVERAAMVDSFMVDSVDETWQMRIHVIGDDSLLAVSTSGKTFLVDLESKEVTSTFPRESVVFSRDSRYYFNSVLWSFPDHVLVSEEAGDIMWVSFCNRSETMTYVYLKSIDEFPWPTFGFYSITGDSVCNWIRYSHGGAPFAAVYSFAVSGLKRAFIGGANPGNFLGVIDFACDTVRPLKFFNADAWIVPVVSPDDKYVFFTDVGVTQFGFSPSEHIFVFETETEDSIAAIPLEGMDMVDYMVISDDGKYMIGRPYDLSEINDTTAICLINLENYEFMGTFTCGFLPGSISAKYAARNGL